MQLTQLKTAAEIHALYSPDKPTQSTDYSPEKGLFKVKACTKLIFIERDDKMIASSEWFITQANNELIYDIADNNWVNLTMFDEGNSYCTGLYTLEVENNTNQIKLAPPISLVIPPFVANWYNDRIQDNMDDDNLFDYLMESHGYPEDPDEDSLDSVPVDIIEYVNDKTNRLIVLRLLDSERFTVAE